jgi:ADP-ribose pyrophosphatase YjhB (NUDIX family)
MGLNRLRRTLEPVVRRVMHFYWRFSRAATLGARAMVIDGNGRIFLVKHSYVDGWHLPGGGVETGESLLEALTRELAEEGNLQLGASPQLYGIYFNKRASRRDHVALFVVRDFRHEPRHPRSGSGSIRRSSNQRVVVRLNGIARGRAARRSRVAARRERYRWGSPDVGCCNSAA